MRGVRVDRNDYDLDSKPPCPSLLDGGSFFPLWRKPFVLWLFAYKTIIDLCFPNSVQCTEPWGHSKLKRVSGNSLETHLDI